MVELIFCPEGTLLITDLSIAWVSKRLGHWRWVTPFGSTQRTERDKRALKTLVDCERKLLEDLADRKLLAVAHVDGMPRLYQIPEDYWLIESAAVSLQGRLFDLAPGQFFAANLAGAPVLVEKQNALAWLKKEGISDTDPYFPSNLLPQPPASSSPRKTQHPWLDFVDEALRHLGDQGAYSGQWRQAALIRIMQAWCITTWDEEPSLSSIKNYVKEAERRFNSEKQGSLVK